MGGDGGGRVGPRGSGRGDGAGEMSADEAGLVDRRTILRLGLGVASAALIAGVTDSLLAGGARRAAAPIQQHPLPTTVGPAPTTTTTTAPTTTAPTTTAPTTTEPTTTTEPAPTTTTERVPTTTTEPPPPPLPRQDLRFFGPTEGKKVYITIDDGWFPSEAVLDIIRVEHLPVTTFLIRDAAQEYLPFWKSFVDAGGQIQNHTVSHPWLTKVSPSEVMAEWEGVQADYANWFGALPRLGRPPYGAVDPEVWRAAREAGLDELVMWSAVDNGDGLQTWNEAPLEAGEIVLMHWDPGLESEFRQVLAAIEREGLVPSFLPLSWPGSSTIS
jgi:peptidoglycan/xylan/chitin deacetylase (PgdA/CDA1 family)